MQICMINLYVTLIVKDYRSCQHPQSVQADLHDKSWYDSQSQRSSVMATSLIKSNTGTLAQAQWLKHDGTGTMTPARRHRHDSTQSKGSQTESNLFRNNMNLIILYRRYWVDWATLTLPKDSHDQSLSLWELNYRPIDISLHTHLLTLE